jgi:ABC-2 type transport system permease protein
MNKIFSKLKNTASGKKLKNGSYAALSTIIVLAVIVLLNRFFSLIPDSSKQIDLSANHIYAIGDTTRKVIDGLEHNVDIIVIAETGTVDTRIDKFINLYGDASDKITVTSIDPVVYPSALTKYNTDSDTVIIKCDDTEKQTSVTFDDIIVYDQYYYYYYGEYYETEFDGEGLITSALQYVSSDINNIVYVMEGHGESTLNSTILSLLSKSNFETSDVNLLTDGGVPEDCELLISYAPQKDFSVDEYDLLTDYLADGGNLMLILDSSAADTPNIEALLNNNGLERVDGAIADTSRYYMSNPYIFFPVYGSSDITDSLSGDRNILLYNAYGMKEISASDENITVTPFLTTSTNGVAVTEDSQLAGKYIIGALSENTGRLTVITSTELINEQLLTNYPNLDNQTLFVNAVTANYEDAENISIPAVSLEVTYNTPSNGGIWSMLFIFVIPAATLIYGFVKWLLRRKA